MKDSLSKFNDINYTLPNNHEKYKRDDKELHELWRTPAWLLIHNTVSLFKKNHSNCKKLETKNHGLMVREEFKKEMRISIDGEDRNGLQYR